MQTQTRTDAVSGHVRLIERKRGPQWYVKFRLADGRQVQRRLGPDWREKGRPPAGHYTRKLAEAELRAILVDAARGDLPASVRSGHTFGEACDELLRYVEHDRERARSTLRDYRNVVRSQLLPEFGRETPLEAITTERLDDFRGRLLAEGRLSRRSVQKAMILLHGIFGRAKRKKWIRENPAVDVERVTVKRSGDFNVLTPEQVEAVARVTESEQDAALFAVAAYSGLRLGELRALRWRDVDFAGRFVLVRSNFTHGGEGRPKSGKVRSVPLIDQAAVALDGLSRREFWTAPEDLVFPSPTGTHFDDGPMRERFYDALAAAELGHLREREEPITFHDLRHTFGTLGAAIWPLHDLQGYMGHADVQTTMIYVHHVPKASAAEQLTRAVEAATAAPQERTGGARTTLEVDGGSHSHAPARALPRE